VSYKNAICYENNNHFTFDIMSLEEEQQWCLNSVITPVYFIFFVLVAQFVLMNVVIAVLMKQLEVSEFI
jgi:voltage-dependent calcium channel T type alpha-1G